MGSRISETIRIAHPIDSLMMVADDLGDFRIVLHLRKDPLADRGVLLHLLALLKGQRTRLLEQTWRESDLSDVVNKPAEVRQLLLFIG